MTIAVKPTKKPGLAVMNLRSITLKPAERSSKASAPVSRTFESDLMLR